MSNSDPIAHNIATLQQQIKQCCQQAKRSPDTVHMLAVSKRHSIEHIEQAFHAGQRHFGENYWQELTEKQQQLSHLPIIWHYIGKIQSRKAPSIGAQVDWVHSVDSIKVAQRLVASRTHEQGALNCFLQINLDREPQKSGLLAEEITSFLEHVYTLDLLQIRGLMILPSAQHDARKRFSQLAALQAQLATQFPQGAWDHLSMGMSADWQQAIAAGATFIRLGTAVFGQRL